MSDQPSSRDDDIDHSDPVAVRQWLSRYGHRPPNPEDLRIRKEFLKSEVDKVTRR